MKIKRAAKYPRICGHGRRARWPARTFFPTACFRKSSFNVPFSARRQSGLSRGTRAASAASSWGKLRHPSRATHGKFTVRKKGRAKKDRTGSAREESSWRRIVHCARVRPRIRGGGLRCSLPLTRYNPNLRNVTFPPLFCVGDILDIYALNTSDVYQYQVHGATLLLLHAPAVALTNGANREQISSGFR